MRKPWIKVCICAALLVFVAYRVEAQSTSPWVQITDESPAALPAGSLQNPTLGDAYLTADFVAARVYQKSNWWTNIVEKNRVGVIDTKLSGMANGRDVSDARTSKPIELRKNNSLVDLGFATNVAGRLPTTFSRLELTVNIGKSSKDGLAELLSALGDISASTPSLQLSQSTLGIVSGAKLLADFLFNKTLLKAHAQSVIDFQPTGNSLPAGLYVSFAADSAADYSSIINNSPDVIKQKLRWNGGALRFDGQELGKLTYYIVRVHYMRRVFDDPLASLSLSPSKPWAALYQIANGKVSLIVPGTDLEKLKVEVINHLINANTLLDNDPDYIQKEKDEIKAAVLAMINSRLIQKRPGAVPFKVPVDTTGVEILKKVVREELQKQQPPK